MVNTTFSGCGKFISLHTSSRHSYTFSAAFIAAGYAPLPGLDIVLRAFIISVFTDGGFKKLVAAESRYII